MLVIVDRSSQWGGDVHPPGTTDVPVAPKRQENLHCPDEKQQGSCPALPTKKKQRGSCTALTEKQRVAALRPKNSNGDTSLRVLESYDPKRLHGCGFVLLLLVFFFFFVFVQRWYPARPSTNFRWRVQIIPPGLHTASGGG